MLLKNRCFKYRFRNEIKNNVFSHTEENICEEKRPSSLRLKKKMVRGKKKKAPFSQVAQITHRHRKVTNAIHERMHHKHQHLFILNFFFQQMTKDSAHWLHFCLPFAYITHLNICQNLLKLSAFMHNQKTSLIYLNQKCITRNVLTLFTTKH